MIRFWKSLYIGNRFFYVLGMVVFLLGLSYAFPLLFFPARLTLLGFAGVCLLDILILYGRGNHVSCTRQVAPIFSLGDLNTVRLQLHNEGSQKLHLNVIEELPEQLQMRDFQQYITLSPKETKTIAYTLEPKERGSYVFYHTLLFLKSPFTFFERKLTAGTQQNVAVYPSVMQVKKYQLQSHVTTAMSGIKKIRRLGHNYEFDHVKTYVKGDDYRSINWKLTGKRHSLMVNQYDDEKSQQIYCIIDNGRAMRMPFAGLSLLDYSINSALVLASTATQKQDRAGLLTFSKKINTFLKADSSHGQLQKIFQGLYNEKESENEPNFELLYTFIRRSINIRSVMFLFTNFESQYSLQRVLPMLRMLNKAHLLIVVLFENDELRQLATQETTKFDEIFTSSIAEKLINEKKQLATHLKQHGIHTILTSPEKLTVNTVNKYLELKSRGLA